MRSILDHIKVFKNIETYKGPGPRNMAQEPRIELAGGLSATDDLHRRMQEAKAAWKSYKGFSRFGGGKSKLSYLQFFKLWAAENMADGGRIGKPGGIVEPGVKYYGKLVDEPPSSKNVGNTSPVKKGKFIYPRTNRWGTVWSDTPHGGAEGWEKIRTPREQGIQIKLLEATNKKGKFNAAKFAKDNDISMKELKKQSNLLQGNIYDKRMLVSGKDMGGVKLKWIPEDATISDNALSKLHKSGLITYERTKIDELFYDAFGRPKIKGTNIDNPSFNNKKYLAIKNNLNEYRQLKDAINLKYPSINFQLDHPLSKSTLKNIFNASAEKLTRVNVLDAHLNNAFKDSLSQKYQTALGYNARGEKVGKVNLEAKKAVEKVARDLKLNIGKVSKDLTGFDYGVKEFQKLNIRDEIIKSLKNQKDLNLNFKSYIKNNPDLLKIAGFDDPSKIGTKLTKITDRQIKGVENFFNQKGSKKFLDSFTKTFQDLSPQSVLQMGRTHGCLKKQEGGSIMTCLQTKFKADPEKFLQRSAPLAKGNPNLFKWFKNGRKIARGTGIALAWEAAFAPIIAGWGALEGQSGQRILNDIAYGIPFIGETTKEEFMREAGGDESAYAMKRLSEIQDQELPYLKQQKDAVINKMAHVPGKSPKQYWIEKDIEEKELELQDIWNKSGFMEGPAASYLSEDKAVDAFNLYQQTTEKIAADTAARKKATFDSLRKAGIIADRNWQSQVSYAGGGMVGDKSGPPPESGPMSQGLRSLYNNVRKR